MQPCSVQLDRQGYHSSHTVSLHTCDVLLAFQLSVIFMNVNGFKTKELQLYCRDFQLFHRIQDDKFPEHTLAKPIS